MLQKSSQSNNFDNKSISKDIKHRFLGVLQSLQLQMRVQNINRHQQLQKIQNQVRLMTQKVNEFSNLLLHDNFMFNSLNDHPLIMIKYCVMMFQILIKNHNISGSNINNNNNNINTFNNTSNNNNIKSLQSKQHSYNQNNIYEVMSAVKLQNYDLKQKVKQLNQQLQLAKKRANIAEEILDKIKINTQKFMQNYKINFTTMCDLLKKAQNNQIQLLQDNRFLKQQLQSLTIQFDRYKQYFKQGPSLKDKQDKLKYQFQKQYQEKLKNTIKQVERSIKSQLERTIVEKLKSNNGNLSIISKNGRDIKIR